MRSGGGSVGTEQDSGKNREPKRTKPARPQDGPSSPPPNAWVLQLQQSAGNRAVASSVHGPPVVSRAPTPGQPKGPVAGGPQFGAQEMVNFEPTFTIVPGGLGPGAVRNQQQVFRGDTLIFKANLVNASAARVWMEGQVVGDSPAACTVDGTVATWRVVVGKMGVPGQIGQPAALVDAIPKLETLEPPPYAPKQFQQAYHFRVVADLSWLSGQCQTAGGLLQSAFLGLSSLADQAYLNYDSAYQLHKAAVDDNGKRKQLQNDILLGILLAGVGGAVGGAVAERVKTPAIDYLKAASSSGSDGKLGGAAIATSIGDISKYAVRLAGMRTPGSHGQQGSDTPDPTASPGTAKAAGTTPERWHALKVMELTAAAKTSVDTCNELKKQMDEAWAQGKTDLMDVDPVQLVQKNVEDLKAKITISTPKEYAIGLWRTWIHTYGITAIPNWAGGKTRTDELAGHTAFTDSKLYDDIHSQVGDALDDDVARLRQETAPDPLTEMPD